ncbi:hypothetical protein VX037_15345 [Gordonia sp. Z-3]|uniref:hypothetical protein n=1 Tax=Gordonia sp. Z-3 TaxID=3115408 RepID=UPI002E2AC2D8|nr:hypothetical protein [Gordonia sp. Z-3]MED5802406.1 hypothetical protein [Gordonia sp. Z-3]
MTNMGGNGIRRSQKVQRRRNRKQRRHGAAAGVAALATVAAVGAGQMMGPAQAEAVTIPIPGVGNVDIDNPAGQLGEIIGGIANNAATQEALKALRIELCASGGTSGGADCSQSTGTGIAIIMPTRIELVPRVDDPNDSSNTDILYNGTKDYLNNPPVEPQPGDFPNYAAYLAAYAQYVIEDGAYTVAEGAAQVAGIDIPIPDAPVTDGSAKVIGSGFQFALASGGGDATAISYLPVSLATAGASGDRTAVSFAILGMANAWTTDEIPVTLLGSDNILGIDLPAIPAVQQVSCYGGLTGAYAEGVGACANVLGTFDFRWSQPNGEVQFALTDPSAVLTDPSGVFSQVITQLLNGEPFTLSKDFARLSFAGDYDLLSGNFVRFTSDYGTQESTTINWLGQQLTLNPMVTVNGQERPNHLGVPILTLGALDTGEIVPVLHIPDIEFPFGIPSAGPFVIPDTSSSMTSSVTLASSEGEAPVIEPTMQRMAALSDPVEAEPESAADETEEYVGKHRTADATPEYVGKHRADDTADTPSDDDPTTEAPAESTDPGEDSADTTDTSQNDATETEAADTESAAADATESADETDATDTDATDTDSTESDADDAATDGGDAGSSSVDEG